MKCYTLTKKELLVIEEQIIKDKSKIGIMCFVNFITSLKEQEKEDKKEILQ
jgi:hypothetical protein